MIDEEGSAAVTIRALAQRLGVSHAAPGYHFADRDALLVEVATEGFRLFADTLEAAARGTPTPTARLVAVGLAYVRFASQHPSYLRVMFGRGSARDSDWPEALQEEAHRGYQALTDAVESLVATLPGDPARSTRLRSPPGRSSTAWRCCGLTVRPDMPSATSPRSSRSRSVPSSTLRGGDTAGRGQRGVAATSRTSLCISRSTRCSHARQAGYFATAMTSASRTTVRRTTRARGSRGSPGDVEVRAAEIASVLVAPRRQARPREAGRRREARRPIRRGSARCRAAGRPGACA